MTTTPTPTSPTTPPVNPLPSRVITRRIVIVSLRPASFRERMESWLIILTVAAVAAGLLNTSCANPFSRDVPAQQITSLEPGR